MARTKRTARKSTGGKAPGFRYRHCRAWHPALTRAAEEGGQELLDEALRAKTYATRHGMFVADVKARGLLHSAAVLPGGSSSLAVQSPFPAQSHFSMTPYATWHGHLRALRGFLDRHSPVDGLAEVLVESYPKQWALEGLQLDSSHICYTGGALSDGVRVTALQIAIFQRNTAAARLLLDAGAQQSDLFLLDVIRPLPGSLFASKAGTWSPESHFCFPPAFKAAAAELLRITHKHSGTVRNGRLAWPFARDTLLGLLLPLLAREPTDWLEVPSREGYEGGEGSEEEEEEGEDREDAEGED